MQYNFKDTDIFVSDNDEANYFLRNNGGKIFRAFLLYVLYESVVKIFVPPFKLIGNDIENYNLVLKMDETIKFNNNMFMSNFYNNYNGRLITKMIDNRNLIFNFLKTQFEMLDKDLIINQCFFRKQFSQNPNAIFVRFMDENSSILDEIYELKEGMKPSYEDKIYFMSEFISIFFKTHEKISIGNLFEKNYNQSELIKKLFIFSSLSLCDDSPELMKKLFSICNGFLFSICDLLDMKINLLKIKNVKLEIISNEILRSK